MLISDLYLIDAAKWMYTKTGIDKVWAWIIYDGSSEDISIRENNS